VVYQTDPILFWVSRIILEFFWVCFSIFFVHFTAAQFNSNVLHTGGRFLTVLRQNPSRWFHLLNIFEDFPRFPAICGQRRPTNPRRPLGPRIIWGLRGGVPVFGYFWAFGDFWASEAFKFMPRRLLRLPRLLGFQVLLSLRGLFGSLAAFWPFAR
jgi:hypothetical protein